MKIDFYQVYEGWRNHLFPPEHLKKAITRVSRERIVICRKCEYNSKNKEGFTLRIDEHCINCGCPLAAKTKCLSCSCPLKVPRWNAVITEEQEEEINNEKGE